MFYEERGQAFTKCLQIVLRKERGAHWIVDLFLAIKLRAFNFEH